VPVPIVHFLMWGCLLKRRKFRGFQGAQSAAVTLPTISGGGGEHLIGQPWLGRGHLIGQPWTDVTIGAGDGIRALIGGKPHNQKPERDCSIRFSTFDFFCL
jgi:hypothetical protein